MELKQDDSLNGEERRHKKERMEIKREITGDYEGYFENVYSIITSEDTALGYL